MIIAGTTEVFLNHFVKKMDLFSSVMAPRVCHQVIYQNSLSSCSTVLIIFRLVHLNKLINHKITSLPQ